MKNQTVKLDGLADALKSAISQYSDELIKDMPEIVKEAAKETAKELKSKAGSLFKGTKYNKSFKTKKQSGPNGITTYTVYSTEYRLTHLLEHGHVIKNQTGQIYGMTAARPHWQPAEEAGIKLLEEKLSETAKGE